jgi:hypothetical protein
MVFSMSIAKLYSGHEVVLLLCPRHGFLDGQKRSLEEVVDLRRFELLTPWLQTRCSPN